MLATGRVGLYKGIAITLSFITTCVSDSNRKRKISSVSLAFRDVVQNVGTLPEPSIFTVVKRCDSPKN